MTFRWEKKSSSYDDNGDNDNNDDDGDAEIGDNNDNCSLRVILNFFISTRLVETARRCRVNNQLTVFFFRVSQPPSYEAE